MVADIYETNLKLKTVDDAKSIIKETLEGVVDSPYCKLDPILVEATNILLAYPQKAHWIINQDESSEDAVVKCSNCGYTIITKFNDRDLKSFKDKYPFCKCCGFGMLNEESQMREATSDERKGVEDYIGSISTETGYKLDFSNNS